MPLHQIQYDVSGLSKKKINVDTNLFGINYFKCDKHQLEFTFSLQKKNKYLVLQTSYIKTYWNIYFSLPADV